jgi:PAS domain S-box-containing protein
MKDEQCNAMDADCAVHGKWLAELLKAAGLKPEGFNDVQDAMQALLQRARELRASEERLRIVADYTYDWEYWILPDGRLEYCSPSSKRITGYDLHEFLDDPGLLDRIIHPEDAHIWREHCQAATEKPEHLHAVFRIINRAGNEVWISHHCLAIFDEDGRYQGQRASNRNINVRKQAEAELKQQSEELELYFTSSLDLLCIANVDGRFVRLNPEWENVLGYSIAELEGRMFLDFVHPEDVEPTMAAVSRLENQEQVLNFVNRFCCKDGSYRWMEWRSRPLGRGIYAVARDITERRAMEEALRKSQETFQNIVQTSPMGIHLYQLQEDDTLVFTGANPVADRLLGVDHGTFIGKTIEEAFPPLQATEVPGRYRQAARHGQAWHTEQIAYDHDGIAGAFEVHAFRISPGNIAVMFSDITDRKRAETQLQQSEENLARTLQSIGDGVISTDMEGKIVRMNPVAEKLCGWSESEAKGRLLGEVFRIINARTREPAEDPVQKVFATGQVVGLANHTLLLSKHGGEFQIADSAAPIKDRDGNITGAVLVFRDVTQEYAQAERLRISEDRLDQAMAVKNEGMWDWNLVTNETYFDDRYYTMAGYAPNAFPANFNDWAEHVHPEDLGTVTSAIEGYLAGKTDAFDVEFRFRHNNGSWMWIQGRGKVVERTSDGAPLRIIGTHADITERRRAEEALLESEEMQRKVLQAVPDLIIRTDLEGLITFVNEMAFPGLENVPETSILGRNVFSIIAEHDRSRAMDNALARIEKSIGAQEYQLNIDGGIVIDAEVNGAVIRDRESKAVGMVYVIRDITERKQAARDQAKLQAQFIQAQKMESVGILAGGVAHDFNNLLHVMRGNIDLLARNLSNDPQSASRVETVNRSLNRAAMLVRQLLLFSRKAEYAQVRVDVNQEVRETCRMLERTIPKMITLELYLDPETWAIYGDPVQVEQVLINLANNSVDAMPGDGRLLIETRNINLDADFVRRHPGANAGPHVLLTVTDTGRGMDDAIRRHVFDPFFTTKQVGKGTGLGLASVYGIVKAHGGYIHCYSEPGSGTTFQVHLPAAEADEIPQGTLDQLESRTRTGMGNDQGGQTILIVDDEREIRELTQEALEDFGYAVLTATNGEEALAIYQELGHSIDLVLLDLNMPGMGGHKCLQELLRLDPAIRVLIASGYSANGQARATMESGAAGFIGKPYQLRELQTTVLDALGDGQ